MTITLTYPEGCALVAGGVGNVGAGVTRRLAQAGLPVTFTYPALMEQLIRMIRLGRPNKPEEAGDLFAFLASEQAAFITGQIIAIDGGGTL